MTSPEALRTPDERFANLPDFPYPPKYVDDLPGYEGLRAAYIDQGPTAADRVFLCLHGQPTWSYLYRKMIPVFLGTGARVVAPDFYGFGRSDKPIDDSVYTFDFHRNMLLALLERLDLQRITFVVQDWGGLLGLTLPMEAPERFERLLCMNTGIATGQMAPSEGFTAWKAYNAQNPDLDIAKLMSRAVPGITAAECAAYAAPFPDQRYKGGVRRFPELVPVTVDMDGAEHGRNAAQWWSSQWSGPTFMGVGVQDPVLGPPVMKMMAKIIRGCPEPVLYEGAGHFVQELGAVVATDALASFAAREPVREPS